MYRVWKKMYYLLLDYFLLFSQQSLGMSKQHFTNIFSHHIIYDV